MDDNTGRSEGATAEKAVPFPCAVLDPNRSFVELRVGEPRPGARNASPLCPSSAWKAFGFLGPSPVGRLAGPGSSTRQRRVGALPPAPLPRGLYFPILPISHHHSRAL